MAAAFAIRGAAALLVCICVAALSPATVLAARTAGVAGATLGSFVTPEQGAQFAREQALNAELDAADQLLAALRSVQAELRVAQAGARISTSPGAGEGADAADAAMGQDIGGQIAGAAARRRDLQQQLLAMLVARAGEASTAPPPPTSLIDWGRSRVMTSLTGAASTTIHFRTLRRQSMSRETIATELHGMMAASPLSGASVMGGPTGLATDPDTLSATLASSTDSAAADDETTLVVSMDIRLPQVRRVAPFVVDLDALATRSEDELKRGAVVTQVSLGARLVGMLHIRRRVSVRTADVDMDAASDLLDLAHQLDDRAGTTHNTQGTAREVMAALAASNGAATGGFDVDYDLVCDGCTAGVGASPLRDALRASGSVDPAASQSAAAGSGFDAVLRLGAQQDNARSVVDAMLRSSRQEGADRVRRTSALFLETLDEVAKAARAGRLPGVPVGVEVSPIPAAALDALERRRQRRRGGSGLGG